MPENYDEEAYRENLEMLQLMFPNKALLSIEEGAKVLGVSKRTVYNTSGPRAEKKFPVPIVRLGGPKFRIIDIAKHLASL